MSELKCAVLTRTINLDLSQINLRDGEFIQILCQTPPDKDNYILEVSFEDGACMIRHSKDVHDVPVYLQPFED